MDNDTILLTESILNIFRKKNAGECISKEELDQVIKRFKELVNYESSSGK